MNRENELKSFSDNKILMISLVLVFAVVVSYWQVGGYGFINLDDRLYVAENQHVVSGLNMENVIWAFTSFRASNWHPLTWISHMIDCRIFGLNAGMHHLVNVLFHIANSLLLFLILFEMIGKLGRSAFVAFLFALHPLHAESVAWVAERKDVLSTFFWMLAMLCYCRYAKHSGLWRYMAALAAFLLGLMAKPMIVTLPFVFLLLDYWPLGRIKIYAGKPAPQEAITKRRISYLLLEKAPFFFLVAISSMITLIAQKGGGAVASIEALPVGERIANAVVSYAMYLYKTALPLHLAFFYPHPQAIPWLYIAASAGVLVLITLGAVLTCRRCPYLLVGWLWYLGTLVPVIGIVQVGGQAMADRYTYIPLIGIFIMISCGAADIVSSLRLRKPLASAFACAVLLVLTVLTWRQAGYWHDDLKLSRHAVEVTKGNYLAYNNLGLALEARGNASEAVDSYKKALEINPRYLDAHINIGVALSLLGREGEAAEHYKEALLMRPDLVEARINLGGILMKGGRVEEAIGEFREALKTGSGLPEAHNALGVALARKGDLSGAMGEFREALRIDPGNTGARMNLERLESMRVAIGDIEGRLKKEIEASPGKVELYVHLGDVYGKAGWVKEAIGEYEEALKIDNGYVPALSRLAVAYGMAGEDGKALGVLKELAKRRPGSGEVCYNIACIYSRRGEVGESVKWLKGAVERGFKDIKLMERDKDLENIRGSAYYKQLVGGAR